MKILSEHFYQALFEQSAIPMAILKADAPYFTIAATNQAYHTTTHRTIDQIIGQSALNIFASAEVDSKIPVITEALTRCIDRNEATRLPVLTFETAAGFSYWQIEITPVTGEKGAVDYLICSTQNITPQEKARLGAEATRVREQELNEELVGANQELADANSELAAANEELITVTEELSLSQENLKILNFELEDRVKRRTMALTESEIRLRNVFEQAPVGICVLTGSEFTIELANDVILSIWDKTRAVIGSPHSTVRPELENESINAILQQVYTTGKPYGGNEVKAYKVNRGEQDWGYYNFVYQPLLNKENAVTGIMIIVDDVTDNVLARQEKLRNAEQVRLAKNAAQLGMFDMDVQTGALEWDARCRQLFGISHNHPVNYEHDFLPGLHPDDREWVNEVVTNVFNKALTDGEFDVEYRTIGIDDKRLRWVRAKGRVFFDEQDRPLRFIGTVLDITEQVNIRRELEDNEKRLRFMLNAIPQQVWTAKPDGTLDYVNQVIINNFGHTGLHIVNQGWYAFIHPEDLPACIEAWETSLAAGKDYAGEFRLRFKDGSYRWHLSRAVPLAENGMIKLWIGTNTDIDEQKNNEHKKDEFLSIASHELKTPLTSIKAFNQLMQRTGDPQKLNRFVAKSAEHITRLERLINDLLDVTKLNAGKMTYDMQLFDFKQMLQESVESVQQYSPSHHIVIEQADDITYTGDRLRLEQVLNNFLSNAIKYSPDASRVVVNSRVQGDNLIVSVQDFGIGIAEESLDRLFDRYYRVDNTAMRFEGLGLGLFISSEILKRHNGTFWIDSKQGAGSIFYFRLPITLEMKYNPMIQEVDRYQDNTITVTYSGNGCLSANWTGFQTFETVKQGCIRMLEMINRHRCNHILNDNREVLGTWSEASEWVEEVFFPMMEKAGIIKLAWIFSPSVFSQLSAKKSVDVAVGNITTQFFTDIHEAEHWVCEGTVTA